VLTIDLQTLYVAHTFVAAGISAALALYLVPRWNTPSARTLLLLVSAVSLWSFFYGMEFKSSGLEAKLFWVRMEYLGAVWTGLLFFRFVMILTGRRMWLSGPRSWLLFVVPVLTLAGVLTNAHHQLIWSQVWVETSGPIPALAYDRGAGFWVFVIYSYGLLLAGTGNLLHGYLFSQQIENRHLWVMLVGVMAPWVSNVIYLMEIEPMRHVDLTPAAFAISGMAFFWGTIRHQMLELIPIARDAVIEDMQDAVFVLDLQHRVVDLNAAARQLIPQHTGKAVGKPLSRLYPMLFTQVEQSRAKGIDDVELAKNDFQLKKHHDFQQIKIERHYAPEIPEVSCDAGQIQQVIFNILKNGAQAMWKHDNGNQGPQFTLSVHRLTDWVCISIADNGPGMDESVRKRIFEPFFTTKATGSGTGLGLSIAYFIITENHDVMLSVVSALGRGTTFEIKLPLK
jgi:PAS domain-containing protein